MAVVDINEKTAQATAGEIRESRTQIRRYSHRCLSFVTGHRYGGSSVNFFGRIDILCNNAGISHIIKLVDMTEQDWDRMIDINIKGVFLCSKYVVPHMIAQGGGRIINTASYLGKLGVRELSHYCASKFAVVGFTQSLAHELAPYGILVNAIGPGDVDTLR